ncbi:MAG: glycosyl hydrolase family 28-related protein [Planctomycetia bacterium]
MKRLLLVASLLVSLVASLVTVPAVEANEEFVGPFPSWVNAKTEYGLIGDGKADDTEALQKALDTFLQKGAALYLPAGTYRITKTLDMVAQQQFQIVGEDPATTIIKWDGAEGDEEAMLSCNGVCYAKFSRLTWHGGGKNITAVYHRWGQDRGGVGTGLEHADEHFVDVAFGIRAGKPKRHLMDAETMVVRCRFVRCSVAGVRIQSFNALDWFIWDSEFDDCEVGITNDPGAGHFHAYRNIFRRSKVADVTLRNASYFGIRHNLSLESNRFFEGRDINGWAVQVTLQGNTVIDPRKPVAIQVANVGPMVMLDNAIRSRDDVGEGPVVTMDANMDGQFVAVGNTFTVAKPFVARGQFLELETKTVAAAAIGRPDLPGAITLPSLNRTVLEVPRGANAATLQELVDKAGQFQGKRPVIHFPSGVYSLDKTITVPAGLDVQFVGDAGYEATKLKAEVPENGPAFVLASPARATFRDLSLVGDRTNVNVGIIVAGADQPGARITGDGLDVSHNREVGLLVDGVEHTDLSFRTFYHSGNQLSVKVVGSPNAKAGKPVVARTALFGGASSNNQFSYDVANGGRLLVLDTWYEGAPPTFLKMTEGGTFTMNGGQIAPGRPGPNADPTDPSFAGVVLENFRGRTTFLGVRFQTRAVIAGDTDDTNVLLMAASLNLFGYRDNLFPSPPPKAHVAMVFSTRSAAKDEGLPPSRFVPDFGTADAAWVLQMLAQVRADTPRPLTALPKDVTDVRFYRTKVSHFATGIKVEAR